MKEGILLYGNDLYDFLKYPHFDEHIRKSLQYYVEYLEETIKGPKAALTISKLKKRKAFKILRISKKFIRLAYHNFAIMVRQLVEYHSVDKLRNIY